MAAFLFFNIVLKRVTFDILEAEFNFHQIAQQVKILVRRGRTNTDQKKQWMVFVTGLTQDESKRTTTKGYLFAVA